MFPGTELFSPHEIHKIESLSQPETLDGWEKNNQSHFLERNNNKTEEILQEISNRTHWTDP